MSDVIITADKPPWYQWDTGLTVTVSGGAMTECHFANRKQGTAYVQAVIAGIARVPDELLQVAAPIKVYGYVSDGAGGAISVPIDAAVCPCCKPPRVNFSVNVAGTVGEVQVVAMS